ncbi:MAG: GAF domain-containing protein [Gemmatimonadaceae bacterium]
MTTSKPIAANFVDPRTPVNLTNCDREPIHIPGAIQPNGVLLAFREADAQIVQASANAEAVLNCGRPVGANLSAILGPTASEIIRTALGSSTQRVTARVETLVGLFDATIHRSDNVAIVELEQSLGTDGLDPAGFRDLIRETLDNIARASTVSGLAGEVAQQMRTITGFDRVWVYFFHEDWHGEIIGESMRDGIEPWLGLHYPASDIPTQARELFLKNWLRMIPDVGFTPIPLVPVENPVTGKPLDLGNSVLRSVSPIHIEYLTNMGVKASLVISLIHRGRLWGLISGHHYSGPKTVSVAVRTICEFLAQALSLQLGMAEQIEDTEGELEVKRIEARLREKLADPGGYVLALTRGSPSLLELGQSTGAAICDGSDCVTVGDTPAEAEVIDVVRWLRANNNDSFRTTMLSKQYPPAANWTHNSSGLMAVALSPKRPHYILWFKPEYQQTVRWAGDPNKPATMGDGNIPRLSPRGSFALWEEERRGVSSPWSQAVVDAAADLRRTLLDLLLKKAKR